MNYENNPKIHQNESEEGPKRKCLAHHTTKARIKTGSAALAVWP